MLHTIHTLHTILQAKGSSTSLGKRAGKGSSQVLTLTVESMGGAAEAVRRVTAQLQACLRELEVRCVSVHRGWHRAIYNKCPCYIIMHNYLS